MKKDNILPIKLKLARDKTGWTQEQVAEKLNISIGTLSGYERGYRSPNPEIIRRIAEIYDVSPDYLFGWSDGPGLNQITDSETIKELDEIQKEIEKLSSRFVKAMEKQLTKQEKSPT